MDWTKELMKVIFSYWGMLLVTAAVSRILASFLDEPTMVKGIGRRVAREEAGRKPREARRGQSSKDGGA